MAYLRDTRRGPYQVTRARPTEISLGRVGGMVACHADSDVRHPRPTLGSPHGEGRYECRKAPANSKAATRRSSAKATAHDTTRSGDRVSCRRVATRSAPPRAARNL